MKVEDGNVSFVESKRVKIERWLTEKGFFLGSPTSGGRFSDGRRDEMDIDDGFGLVVQVPKKEEWFDRLKEKVWGHLTWDIFAGKPRKEIFIASIWLQNPSGPLPKKKVGATANNWVVEVYGREYFDRLIELSKEMSTVFGVKIHVRLEREHPRSASYYMED